MPHFSGRPTVGVEGVVSDDHEGCMQVQVNLVNLKSFTVGFLEGTGYSHLKENDKL